MIVGQETKNWFDVLSNTNINVKDILNCYKGFELGKNYHNSPFWRFSKNLFSRINPGANFKGSLWTNLSKVDQEGTGVNQFVRSTNKMGYELLIKEIEITKPDIIIFLTSWKEDDTLKNLFNKLTLRNIEGLPYKYLIRLDSALLPVNSFRTYHPRFLNDSNRSDFSINEIINHIMNNII